MLAPSGENFRAFTALFPTDPRVIRGENSGNGGGELSVLQMSKQRARSTKHLLQGYSAHKKAFPPRTVEMIMGPARTRQLGGRG